MLLTNLFIEIVLTNTSKRSEDLASMVTAKDNLRPNKSPGPALRVPSPTVGAIRKISGALFYASSHIFKQNFKMHVRQNSTYHIQNLTREFK